MIGDDYQQEVIPEPQQTQRPLSSRERREREIRNV